MESDEVVIERIRSEAFKDAASEKILADKELELTKLKLFEQEKAEKKLVRIRKSPLTVVIAILTVASLIVAVGTYTMNYLVAAILMGGVSILFFVAWLMRMRLIKGARFHLHSLFSLLAVLLIIPFFVFIDDEYLYRNYDKYIWPSGNLSALIPKPQSDYGEIDRDDAEMFDMTIGRVQVKDYNTYINQCVEKGFSVNPFRTGSGYHAFHENGAELIIGFYTSRREMDITVTQKQEFHEYIWPDRGLAALLPKPVSKTGIIESESASNFRIMVAETSLTEFNKYANVCIEAGFSEDMLKLEDYFHANNQDGTRLEMEHNTNNVMKISVYIPLPLE